MSWACQRRRSILSSCDYNFLNIFEESKPRLKKLHHGKLTKKRARGVKLLGRWLFESIDRTWIKCKGWLLISGEVDYIDVPRPGGLAVN